MAHAPTPEPQDDGLPVDREPTLDDVRTDGSAHRSMALGCTFVVAVLVAIFWLLRAGVIG
jgi:hypothetical protein